jgi:glycosyltransferase involved in cell wall biosynthesis
MLNALFTAAWRQMDVAFTLGPRTRDLVIGHWQPRCAVHVIPHGDEGVLNGDGAVLSAEDTDPVALFFGTWSTYKGIDVLLAAFESVRRDLPEARLVLAGAVGADVDHQALLRRARAIGNVDVQAGYVPVADVPALVGSARVLVTPYLRASQSGVIHLAYTFGRPVVASDVGDLSEVVRDGETGFLVPTGDPVALAAAMRKLLSDNSLAARMGECGRRGLAEAWGTAAATMMHALEEVEDS